MRVLVLAAHTDDEVLGVGGTIARHSKRGDEVFACIVADRATDHQYDQEVIGNLRKCAQEASKVLGIKETHFCGLKDERLGEPLIETIVPIEHYVRDVRPDIVYTSHRGDLNQDHQALCRASMIATRAISNPSIRAILCYETVSSTEQAPPYEAYSFIPNVFVDISEVMGIKLEAIKIYSSELRDFPHPRSLEGIVVSAKKWGMKVGVEAAEAFELVWTVFR